MRFILTLKAVITSIVLTFLSSIQPFTDDVNILEQIDYADYVVVEQDNDYGVDFFLVETVYFKDGTSQSVAFNVPKDNMASDNANGMLDIINEIITRRGFKFSSIDENNNFIAVVDDGYKDYLIDKSDGWISDVDSFDYADDNELSKNMWKFGTAWIGFGLFFTFSAKFKSCFDFFIRNKKGV